MYISLRHGSIEGSFYIFQLKPNGLCALRQSSNWHPLVGDKLRHLFPLCFCLPVEDSLWSFIFALMSGLKGDRAKKYRRQGLLAVLFFNLMRVPTSVAKVRRNCQTCGVNLSGTTKCGVTTPHSQLSVMQRKFCENENFTLKWIKVKQNCILLIRSSYIATVTYFWVVVSLEFAPVRS